MKAVLADRPWPRQGMTADRWMCEATPTVVRLDQLVGTQPVVDLAALLGLEPRPPDADPLLHVVRWRGVLYLDNGHARAARALLSGQRTALARVLDIGDGETA